MTHKLAAIIIAALGVWLMTSAMARADLGNAGPGPAPGLCQYPSVCDSGVIGAGAGAVYWYWEDFPIELNGSHRHCEWAYAATEANLGFSMMIQVGVNAPLGAGHGSCQYVCPDMQKADMPNPVGGWKDAIRPTKCQAIAPNPFAPPPPPQDVPIAPPIAEQGAIPSIPFGQQQPAPGQPVQPPPPGAPGGVEPPLAQELPSVTNPVCPNPAATTDEACQ